MLNCIECALNGLANYIILENNPFMTVLTHLSILLKSVLCNNVKSFGFNNALNKSVLF